MDRKLSSDKPLSLLPTLRKHGYKQGDTVSGTILVVDDQWHGLTISKDFTVKVE
jgi:hypothetical protein